MIVDRKLSIRNCKRKDPRVELGEVTPSLARRQLFSPTFDYVFQNLLIEKFLKRFLSKILGSNKNLRAKFDRYPYSNVWTHRCCDYCDKYCFWLYRT